MRLHQNRIPKKLLLLMANKMQAARQQRLGINRNSPFGRFWRWWSAELTAMVPQWLRQSASGTANALLIEFEQDNIVLRRWVQDKLLEQSRVALQSADRSSNGIAFQAQISKQRRRGDRIVLLMPAAQCLVKQIELPAAAAENLRQVIGFEMDRHTPFKADQVYFDFRILRHDAQSGRLIVKLAVAPRAVVNTALESLARWGVPAQAVHVASALSPDGDSIDLMPMERRITKSSRLFFVNVALAGVAFLLLVAAIAVPIWQKRSALISLLPMVEQAKQQATATDGVRRELEKRTSEYNFVLEKKQAIPPLIVQLDELSRLLPDDTWVQQFDLKGKELQLQGETASSSKLIALMETSKVLREANFKSPLTRGSSPAVERFHLSAEVKPVSLAALIATPTPSQMPVAPIVPAAVPAPAGTATPAAPAASAAPANAPPVNEPKGVPKRLSPAEVAKANQVSGVINRRSTQAQAAAPQIAVNPAAAAPAAAAAQPIPALQAPNPAPAPSTTAPVRPARAVSEVKP